MKNIESFTQDLQKENNNDGIVLNFDDRIISQIREIYEVLPQKTGMHFTQVDQVDSIKENGFIKKDHYENFVYLFDQSDTDESFGDQLDKAKIVGLPHYNAVETLKRFHLAFSEGLNRYGLDRLKASMMSFSGSINDFLSLNRNKLPTIFFTDLSEKNTPTRSKTTQKLPQAFFDKLDTKKIIKIISIEDNDFNEIIQDFERGITIDDSLKKILIKKITDWLLDEIKNKSQK